MGLGFSTLANDTKVLSYGRQRSVILEAPDHDKDCVLANILAAHFLCSSDRSRAVSHLQAAKSRLVSLFFSCQNCNLFLCFCFWQKTWYYSQEQATAYEKAVFDAVNYMVSENKDDDVAVELHSKVYEPLTYYGDLGLSSLPADLFTLRVLYSQIFLS